MGQRTTIVGREAEERAFLFLRTQNLTPVARNFHCRGGELDLIMLHDECLVFIEVRRRGRRSFASAAQSVDPSKQRKLIRAAAMFVARHRKHAHRTMRFDVVGINDAKRDGGGSELEWIRDAFRPTDSRC